MATAKTEKPEWKMKVEKRQVWIEFSEEITCATNTREDILNYLDSNGYDIHTMNDCQLTTHQVPGVRIIARLRK